MVANKKVEALGSRLFLLNLFIGEISFKEFFYYLLALAIAAA